MKPTVFPETSKTIRQIWNDVGNTFPFAVTKKSWGHDTCAVIIKFYSPKRKNIERGNMEYALLDKPVGIPLSDNKQSFFLNSEILFQEHFIIPHDDIPQWQ